MYWLMSILIIMFIVYSEGFLNQLWYTDAKFVCSTPRLWFDFGNDLAYLLKHTLYIPVEISLFLYPINGCILCYFCGIRVLDILQWKLICWAILLFDHWLWYTGIHLIWHASIVTICESVFSLNYSFVFLVIKKCVWVGGGDLHSQFMRTCNQ